MIDPRSALAEHLPPPLPAKVITALAELLESGRAVEIVDAGASPLVGEPPCYAPLLEAGVARVTGFEPDPEAVAALADRTSDTERYLPIALGDGDEHTLRTCFEAGFSSLLEPDATQLGVLTDFSRLAEVTGRAPVTTSRLDDVGLDRADLLVLDVQGSEPVILDGAVGLLASTFAVQVEVAFHRLYEDGPTFADVDARLRDAGFVPHAFVTSRTWPLAPVAWDDPLQARARHLVEADLLYVRDPARLADLDDDLLRAGALVAAGAYGSLGLVLLCLRELVRRGVLPTAAEARFRALVVPAVEDAAAGLTDDGAC